MVDSEDFTLEKIKTQELSVEINNLSNTFQLNTTIKDTPPDPPQVQAVDPNNKTTPQIKKYCSFATKIITLFQPAFVDSICLKNLNHNLDPQLHPFINNLKHLQINLNLLANVAEVTTTPTVDLLVILDIILVLTRARILLLDTMINLTIKIILLTTTVIDLDMTNIIPNPPQFIFSFFTFKL